jgi:ABC-type dipeptide/oligopeptide/nickel transport system ATPase component
MKLTPDQRYALVGKSGSGKTTTATAIACALVPPLERRWEIWWVDTKGDPVDRKRLAKWGFGLGDRRPLKSRRLWDVKGDEREIITQTQEIAFRACKQKYVLLVIDEYRHVVESSTKAGPGLLQVHLRGRGLHVGMIGQTQEPAFVPRQLLSQANHLILHSVTYPRDIERVREFDARYPRDGRFPDRHGFLWLAIDEDENRYFTSVREWQSLTNVA